MNRVIIPEAAIHPAVFLFLGFLCFGIVFVAVMGKTARKETPATKFFAYTVILLLAVLPFIPTVTYYTFNHDVPAKTALSEELGVTQLNLSEKNRFINLRCDFFTSTGTYDAKWVRDEENQYTGTLTIQRYSDHTCSYQLNPTAVVK